MKEQFVTYEIAKKMKGFGFNEPCLAVYYDKEFKTYGSDFFKIAVPSGIVLNENLTGDTIAAPLWQQVIDWLREKHKIEVTQTPSIELEKGFFQFNITRDKPHNEDFESGKTHNKAREAAILKALELIS